MDSDMEVASGREGYFQREVKPLNEQTEEDALDKTIKQGIEGPPIAPELGENWGTVIMPPQLNRRWKPSALPKESVKPQEGKTRPAGETDWEEFESRGVHPKAPRRNYPDPFE